MKQTIPSLTSLFHQGVAKGREEHKAKDAAKAGQLRAGNTGALTANGKFLGECQRKTFIRTHLNLEADPPSPDRLIMFKLGTSNEDIWKEILTPVWDGSILCEEDIPITWTTSKGRTVSGRPDMVLLDGAGNKVVGVEHKMVASLWTSRDVLFQGTPNLKHVLQAAHYSWQLGVPFKLVYTQYVDQAVMGWAQKNFPKAGQEYSEFCEYNDKGEIKKVKPFFWVYDVIVDENSIKVLAENSVDISISLPVGSKDIERYYEFVDQMPEKKVLGSRPENLDSRGEKKNYSMCDYCPIEPHCTKHERNFDKWVESVTKELSK